jgi:hypothetical protein
LTRIQLEGHDDELIMDEEGNIYDLNGNYVGTLDQDELAEGEGEGEGEEGD